MSNTANLDSRQKGTLEWYLDFGTSDVAVIVPDSDSLADFVLDSGYTLTLDEGKATEKILTVGNGITLDTQDKSISIALDTSTMEKKTYTGCLVSDSKVVGVYLKKHINVYVTDADC